MDGDKSVNVCGFMEEIAVNTEKSIENRDTTLARDVWSQLTEYSVLAEEDKALAKAIGNVASTYSSLVSYCDSGEEEKLDEFLVDFAKESGELSILLEQDGFEVAVFQEQLSDIAGDK